MARQLRRQSEENHDRWLISYADFITLLFALFVVMYALSKMDENKYKEFSNSLNLFSSILDKANITTKSANKRVIKSA